MTSKTTAYNSNFDYIKFVLCILVVAIHTQLYQNIFYPWLRLVVPVFFILTSYFFFKNIRKTEDEVSLLKKYLIRNLKLYRFWLIALLPITVYVRREIFTDGILVAICKIIKCFLFSSTFKSSWFLMACMIGITLVYITSKKINNKTLLIITAIIYCLVTYNTTYNFMITQGSIYAKIIGIYGAIFTSGKNSFPAGLVWIVMGKIIAERNEIKKNTVTRYALIAICAILLYIEWMFVKKQTGILSFDCYIMLIPTAYLIFEMILTIKPVDKKKNSIKYRKMSSIIYCLHSSLVVLILTISEKIGITLFDNRLILFIIVTSICLLTSKMIFVFNEKIKILKEAY